MTPEMVLAALQVVRGLQEVVARAQAGELTEAEFQREWERVGGKAMRAEALWDLAGPEAPGQTEPRQPEEAEGEEPPPY